MPESQIRSQERILVVSKFFWLDGTYDYGDSDPEKYQPQPKLHPKLTNNNPKNPKTLKITPFPINPQPKNVKIPKKFPNQSHTSYGSPSHISTIPIDQQLDVHIQRIRKRTCDCCLLGLW